MSNYRYTNEEVAQAHNVQLVEFLSNRNEEIKQVGSHSYWSNNGETVSISGNVWFNHYTQKGGDAIAFVKEYFKVGFAEAVGILLGETYSQMAEREAHVKEKKPFVLPEKNDRSNRAFSYLVNKREINKDIVNEFMKKGLIYEDKKYHGVVFVGIDKANNPRHAHERGTGVNSKFKMTASGSEPEYSFHWNGKDNEIFIFEAPIDMLSYISMYPGDWQNHTYAAACSVTDKVLFQCLSDNPQIDTVHICFDNDGPGQTAAEKLLEKLSNKNLIADIIKPDLKDWNEDLLSAGDGPIIKNGAD